MDLYAWLLTAAVAAAAIAVLLGTAIRLDQFGARLVQWPSLLAALSIGLVVVAAVYHLFTGHGPGSPEPLEPIGFLVEHQALAVIVAVALLALGLAKKGRRR